MTRKEIFKQSRRIVVKIGTQVLTSRNNRLDTSVIEHLVEQICWLIEKMDKEIILVTSGAISAGMQVFGWKKRPIQLNKLQAAASVGQSRLMRIYERLFKEEGINVGQILLTRDIFLNSKRKKTAKETLLTLLKFNVIPVINENDSVAVEEIKFGDNDTMSALVTEFTNADMLVLITDVNGLYQRDPKKKGRGRVIYEVKDLKAVAGYISGGRISEKGTGGIKSKIEAVKYVTEKGKACFICNGKKVWRLKKAFEGEKVGTIFYPEAKKQHV
jgi:glutamate 5-kinase